MAEALRLNTTVTSLYLGVNRLGQGGGLALAETLRHNTTLASLDLGGNHLGEEARSGLRQAWAERKGKV